MAARFKKPKSGRAVPVAPDFPNLAAPLTDAFPATPKAAPNYGGGVTGFLDKQFSKLDKPSAAIWDVLSALGSMAKSDATKIKNDPVGELNRFVDEMIIGQESRDRFRQGDYGGAINYSGLGKLAALPEMENVVKGQAGPSDALWLALTYGTGPLGKGIKAATTPAKQAVKKGSTKAYIDILNRLK